MAFPPYPIPASSLDLPGEIVHAFGLWLFIHSGAVRSYHSGYAGGMHGDFRHATVSSHAMGGIS